MKGTYQKKCFSKDCKWINKDNTCSFSECSYEPEDDWDDDDIPGQYSSSY